MIVSPPFFSSTPLLQAQLVDLRSELTEVKSERTVLEREVHDQLLQLHALQLQLHAKQCQADDSGTIKDKLVCNKKEIHPSTPAEWDATYYRMCLLLFSYVQLKTLPCKEKMFDTFY